MGRWGNSAWLSLHPPTPTPITLPPRFVTPLPAFMPLNWPVPLPEFFIFFQSAGEISHLSSPGVISAVYRGQGMGTKEHPSQAVK